MSSIVNEILPERTVEGISPLLIIECSPSRHNQVKMQHLKVEHFLSAAKQQVQLTTTVLKILLIKENQNEPLDF